jgi:tRNA(Arg) A34 adenosine deaminase TadA
MLIACPLRLNPHLYIHGSETTWVAMAGRNGGVVLVTRSRYRTEDPSELDPATAKDRRWINQTISLASSSQHRFPMGAIAVQGGRVIAQAVNRRRNSPTTVEWAHCSFHAEHALVRTRQNLAGSTVYIARLTSSGQPALARPCLSCHRLLAGAGVRRAVWTSAAGCVGVDTLTTL